MMQATPPRELPHAAEPQRSRSPPRPVVPKRKQAQADALTKLLEIATPTIPSSPSAAPDELQRDGGGDVSELLQREALTTLLRVHLHSPPPSAGHRGKSGRVKNAVVGQRAAVFGDTSTSVDVEVEYDGGGQFSRENAMRGMLTSMLRR